MAVETIPDEDQLSRHVDSPHKFRPVERQLIEQMLFEFPGGAAESLVWRKYVVDAETLHAMGCARQLEKRKKNPAWTYEGALTATTGAIRAISNRLGHGFIVEHDPVEGVHHVAIRYKVPEGQKLEKSHKSELKDLLRKTMGEIDLHACDGNAAFI